jgi:hypothetical protein
VTAQSASTTPATPPTSTLSSTAPTDPVPSSSERPRLLHRLAGVVKRNPVKSIAFTYLAVGTAYYLSQRDADEDDDYNDEEEEHYSHKHVRAGGGGRTTNGDNNTNGKNDSAGGDATNPTFTKTKKPKVLVLPFYRMKLVEKLDPKAVAMRRLESLFGSSEDDKDTAPIEMQVDELVSLIHNAAKDPSIVGLVRSCIGIAAEIWCNVLLLF